MRKKIVFVVFFAIIILIITLLLIELSLQIINVNKDLIGQTFLRRLSQVLEPPFSWEGYFLANHATGSAGDIPNVEHDGLHQPHATRGWGLTPHSTVIKGGMTYTMNCQGYRSLSEYKYDPAKYGIIIVGDSFTFGDGIDDKITWPYLLQQFDGRLNVFNLSGSGYGVDQMYITLSEEVTAFRPKLIIAAFIDDDLRRSMLDFRDYKKPRFVINDGKLVITNTPIGNVEETVKEISQNMQRSDSPIQLIKIIDKIRRKLDDPDYVSLPKRSDLAGGCRHDCISLNKKLFETMAEIAARNNADFLMLYLPYGEENSDGKFSGVGESFFNNYRMGHQHFYLNPRAEFLHAGFPRSRGHYKESENRLLSALVYGRIKELPSWKDFGN
ncbi:MAG: SGNH/GDSL hydrolase family protein [Nitrospirae bacterium]|nr:SGNH/GDSL hydrolase family protein [Nitrospirota bacterium]